jgi:hypothetical protein
MWDYISDWLPVIAFLFGTALGWLISTLFERTRKNHLEGLYNSTVKSHIALENQLQSKSRLEEDLGRTNYELEQLKQQFQQMSFSQSSEESREIENINLKNQLKQLRSRAEEEALASEKDYISDYQSFLEDLEKSVKKAKKRAFQNPDSGQNLSTESPSFSKKDKSSKTDKESLPTDKFEFYKQKYSGKQFSIADLNGKKKKKKDLTDLYGINKKIQELLYANDIKSFKDLSKTKIAELRAILSLGGEKFEQIDPLNWPIQARLAEKGHWEILEDYKKKMKM